MFLADWKTPEKHYLPKKNMFLAQGHDENLFVGLHLNNQQLSTTARVNKVPLFFLFCLATMMNNKTFSETFIISCDYNRDVYNLLHFTIAEKIRMM